MSVEPVYIQTHKSGLLKKKTLQAKDQLRHCTMCPRECGVDRIAGESGFCKTGENAVVYSYDAHFGEESPLVGQNGSGTIFFSGCNMLCNFCQNYEISHKREGREVTADQLAFMMLTLQKQGCHNVNVVTPSHVVPQILLALEIAIDQGLSIPMVFNTGTYDKVETLKLLEDVVDIYMPDLKFYDTESAKLAGLPGDYPEVAKNAIREMFRQVGDLMIAEPPGIARRGLLVRHLVMPDGLAGTRESMVFLSQDISKNTYVNVMSQYRPCGTASQIDSLSRRISLEEYQEAVRMAVEEGISRLDH